MPLRDVAGGEPHLIGHTLAEKLLGTDGKHRHGDLAALGEQRLVVGGVLAECSKLLEGIVHRMRPCVQGSIVLPRIFIDPLGVSGQLVPEAIEVDALPALHQTLLVRTPEIEVPQHRAASDVVPIAYSGQRCIDHHPARDPDRILSSQRIADHIADVMCDQVCLLDVECIHDAGNVDRLVLLGVAGIRVIGHTHAAQVGDDHGMVLGQNNCQGGPHITRIAEAMQQHHGRTLAADSDVEAGAVRRNHLRVKAGRKRRDSRHEGR